MVQSGALYSPKKARGYFSIKFYTGKLHPAVQPITLLYTILTERYPFRTEKKYLFRKVS